MKRRPHQQNTLRIIGGAWRGRKLRFPDVQGLRPTPDRVRETLFNWLQGLILDEDCLDLYAGSGACGLEALSRGARHVTFVDASHDATAAIKSHLAVLQCIQADVRTCSAQQYLNSLPAGKQFGLVFMDPPFAARLLSSDCLALERSGALKAGARIYVESGDPLPGASASATGTDPAAVPDGWQLLKHGKAGAVYYGLYQRQGLTDAFC